MTAIMAPVALDGLPAPAAGPAGRMPASERLKKRMARPVCK